MWLVRHWQFTGLVLASNLCVRQGHFLLWLLRAHSPAPAASRQHCSGAEGQPELFFASDPKLRPIAGCAGLLPCTPSDFTFFTLKDARGKQKRMLPLDFKLIFKMNCILYFKEKGIVFPFPYFCLLFLVHRVMFVILTDENVGFIKL